MCECVMCNVRNIKCNVQTGVLAVQGLSASVTQRGMSLNRLTLPIKANSLS